jgi:hypothetical protein
MEREQSRWIGQRRLLILIVVVVVVFCVGEQLLATIPVESQHRPRQNGQLLQGQRPKFLPNHPKYKWMYKLIIIQRCWTCFDLLVQRSMAAILQACKSVLKFS